MASSEGGPSEAHTPDKGLHKTHEELKPRLTVIGVGGAGCNAINNMIAAGLSGVDFVVANTDAQALVTSSAEHRVQLGANLTEGLGAGSRPEIGEAAAEEAMDDLRKQVKGSHMVFVAAGMGGGTGTGAAAVIARAAKEQGILTVGVVTKPFQFEGARRMRIAEAGIEELRKFVDTLIVIPNQNLFRIANNKTTFAEAFVLADQVLYSGVACIVDLIIKEGLINLDFADVRTVMAGMGTAMMGTGEASGERRAIEAAEEAISNPLLDDVSLRGAKGLLLSITGGPDLTLFEVDEAASRVREEVDNEANIIVGATFDENLGDRVRVSIVASGMARIPQVSSGGGFMPTQGHVGGGYAAPQREASQGGWAPAAPPASVPPPPPPAYDGNARREPAQDMHRRLSEALQFAEDPNGETSPLPRHGQPPVSAGSGITIEERPPHLMPTAPGPGWRSGSPTQAAPFAPAPPADVRRGDARRRMPEVSDFPPVAQREYMAKTARQPAPEPSRKRSFFERLTGRGRNESTEFTEFNNGEPEFTSARDVSLGSSNRGENAAPPDKASSSDQDVDFPVFINRDRR